MLQIGTNSLIEQHPYFSLLLLAGLLAPVEHIHQELIVNLRVAVIKGSWGKATLFIQLLQHSSCYDSALELQESSFPILCKDRIHLPSNANLLVQVFTPELLNTFRANRIELCPGLAVTDSEEILQPLFATNTVL